MDIICTTAEAAQLLKCSKWTVQQNLRHGKYKHAAKHGGRWLINLSREYPEVFGSRGPASVAAPTGPVHGMETM